MSRILVIGHKGQLGTDCLSVLPGAVGVDVPDIDISDRFQALEKLNELKPDVIINCAGYTAVDACESDSSCWKVNADGPKHLAEWVADNNAYLVHISTDYVFAGDKPLFQSLEETDRPNPISEYGKSKLAGEQAILDSGAKAAILRTAWLYGANGKNFLKTMLRLALQNPEKEIRVVNDQFGSPTWSKTLSRQIAEVIERRVCGIFHATSEGHCNWYELASLFLQLMKVPHRIAPCTTAEYPTAARRPTNSILENSALKNMGLNLFTDWNDELTQFVAMHRDSLLAEAKEVL